MNFSSRDSRMDFERQPLPVDSFPPNLQMHVKDDAPPKMKMMAAKGMVPAPPAQQVQVLYQLHFDSKFSADVADSLKGIPPNVLLPIVQGDQSEGLLDWIAEVHDDAGVLEALILNNKTADATVCSVAKEAEGKLTEVIANNQVRVLRTPAIIAALYENPSVRMNTVDKLIELAQRNDVDLSQFPSLKNALQGAAAEDDSQGLSEEAYSELLDSEAAKANRENQKLKELEDDGLTRSERERLERELVKDDDEEEDSGRELSLHQKVREMSIAQKIRLGTVGSREAIKLLVRDPNKLVHMAAIQSPRIKVGDVKRLSSNKSLPDGVVNYIARNRNWTSDYEVLTNLVMNPKTPLSEVTGFLKHLRPKELRDLTRNRNVSHQVSRMAKRMLKQRRR